MEGTCEGMVECCTGLHEEFCIDTKDAQDLNKWTEVVSGIFKD